MTVSDWSTLRKLMWLRGTTGGGGSPLTVTLTAGAAPTLVQTTKKTKVGSCAVSFEPWQEGSGDPAPDNVRPVLGWRGCRVHRTGKNLLPNLTAVRYANSSWYIGQNDTTSYSVHLSAGTTYTLTYDTDGASPTAYYKSETGATLLFGPSGSSKSFENDLDVQIWVYADGLTYVKDFQLEIGSTPTAYEPFSGETTEISFGGHTKNLCPNVGGHLPYNNLGVSITRSGDTYNITTKNASGYPFRDIATLNGLKAGTYYLSCNYSQELNISNFGIRIINRNVNPAVIIADVTSPSFTVSEDITSDLLVELAFTGSALPNGTYTVSNIQLEKGTSQTAFEPYGTIYGGTVDVVTGGGENGKGFLDAKNTSWNDTGDGRVYTGIPASPTELTEVLCNVCEYHRRPATGTYDNWVDWGGYPNSNKNLLLALKDITNDHSTWETYIQNNPVQFVYHLATPIPLTLPTASLIIPKGDNYIWAEMIA